MTTDSGQKDHIAGYGSALHSAVEDLLYRAPVGLMTIEFDGTVVAHNRMLCEWLGMPEPGLPGQMVGANAFEWLTEESRAKIVQIIETEIPQAGKLREVMIECKKLSGELSSAILNVDLVTLPSGEQRLHVAMIDAVDRVRFEQQLVAARAAADDANERLRMMQEQLRHGALHDTLTGLPNKALLEEQLRRLLSSSTRTGQSCAILVLDLDHFRQFNADAGYSAGDAVVTEIARRLRQVCDGDEIISRFGGDEFVLAMSPTTREQADALCERIHEAIRVPLFANRPEAVITTSIGGVIWNPFAGEGAPQPRQLFERADRAIYQAKQDGRNTTVIHDWSCSEDN